MIDLDLARQEQVEWLKSAMLDIKTEHHVKLVSEWSETERYLPPSVTTKPGMFSFDVCPYFREVADCFSSESPVRQVDLMKGVQIMGTTAVLENVIGYYIAHESNCPMMLVTADKQLADLRIDKYIVPLLEGSGLSHLIQNNDSLSKNRSGKTKDQISFAGGGFLIPFGANSSNKLRSTSIKILLLDEIDGFKTSVGKDGDPIRLVIDRTSSYEHSRKILKLSTPTVKGASNIESHFNRGDKRYYHVPCKHCGEKQVLRFNGVHKETGEVYGLVWETNGGILDPKSVKYLCKYCGGEHTDADKVDMLAGGEWIATATPEEPTRRSYHISALYSPYGFKTWKSCVLDYLSAWDVEKNKPKSIEALKVFYNNVLGETFEERSDKLDLGIVSEHRRREYKYGEIPTSLAERSCGEEILLLTCAVDVHKSNLAVAVFGWTVNHRAFVVDYFRFEGDCLDVNSQPWQDLRRLIYDKIYQDEHGRKYRIALTMVDSGYAQHVVLEFCSSTDGTVAIKGIHNAQRGATFSEFKVTETKLGIQAVNVNVNFYKDRWYPSLKRKWKESEEQPEYCFNVPIDATDVQLKELTTEIKTPDIDPITKALRGFKWVRSGDNELFDLLMYNNACLDLLAYDLIVRIGERDSVNWPEFWEFCRTGDNGAPYFYGY